ncbi:MAG TPA: NUDIX domain-containing protein, partial [Candidatus Saccharimonadales bacterium]|nr:NUDIX domain-containing protein [Candidatus Saccharimonadales bacterium]
YSSRQAARAVVFDSEGHVALLHATNRRYYKLPGGGIDEGEEPLQALERELREEIGSKAEVTHTIGTILEQRYYWNMTQLSYCYIAQQIGEKGDPELTESEREEGFELIWAKDINEAIRLLESSVKTADKNDLGIAFMRMRDTAIARRAKELLA